MSIEPTKFVNGNNTQKHIVHLMIKTKVTLTDDEGHSEGQISQKGTNGHILQTITLTDIIPGTKLQCNKRHQMT